MLACDPWETMKTRIPTREENRARRARLIGKKEPFPVKPIPVETDVSYLEEWVSRQERINPIPKQPWFRIESELYLGSEKIRVRDIQKACASYYGSKVSEMVCNRREKYLILPRHVAIYLAKELTVHSLVEIGRRFGGRDHTTVISAVRKITRLYETNDEVRKAVDTIRRGFVR